MFNFFFDYLLSLDLNGLGMAQLAMVDTLKAFTTIDKYDISQSINDHNI
jgi:hypothetical protein